MTNFISGLKIFSKVYICLLTIPVLSSCTLSASEFELTAENEGPFLIDEYRLSEIRKNLSPKDTLLFNIRQKIIEDGVNSLNSGPFSVVIRGEAPNNGTIHDYQSIARYWWPNSNTESGYPYVYRDGQPNPEVYETDWTMLTGFSEAVRNLSLAYYFTGDERFAVKASELIKYWFFNEETYMTPHLKFGQQIPGLNEGTSSGIIETISFLNVIDGVSLIYDSKAWTKDDHLKLKVWFSTYLNWLLYSSYGVGASNKANNHSTWYEVQVNAYALFVGKKDIVRQRTQEIYSEKIYSQINLQGTQPEELYRSNSQDYVSFNIKGIINMITLAKNAGINLSLSYSGIIERITIGLDWLKPFATGKGNWPSSQLKDYNKCSYVEIYRRAAIELKKRSYEEVVQKLIENGCSENEAILLYPEPDFN